MSESPRVSRPSVLSLNINSKSALMAAYMPFLTNGGLFLPLNKPYRLGDECFMMLQLLDEPTKYTIAGRVAWVTPAGAQRNKVQGVGVQLAGDDTCKVLKNKIETILAGHLNSGRQTHTL
jgi:type IV pilus assembly protein PilZ